MNEEARAEDDGFSGLGRLTFRNPGFAISLLAPRKPGNFLTPPKSLYTLFAENAFQGC